MSDSPDVHEPEALDPIPLRRQLGAELVGTYALVFMGCLAIVSAGLADAPNHTGVALTWGLIVMAVIYAVGPISGAHLNPAVTCAFAIAGRFPWPRVWPFVGTQCVAALLAGFTLRLMFPEHDTLGATAPYAGGSAMQSFVLEAILTAVLMYVILCVATGSKEQGLMAGIAIGGVVGLEALAAGPICGASMNPARSLGPALAAGRVGELWIYLIAPTLGAALAVPLWAWTRPELGKA